MIGLKGLPAFGGAATVGQNIIANLYNEYDFSVYSVETHTSKEGQQEGYFQIVFQKSKIKSLNIFLYYLKSAYHCLFRANYSFIHLHHIDGAFIVPFLRLKYKVIITIHAQPQVAEKWPWYVKVFFSINERIAIYFSNEITMVSKPLQQVFSKKYRKKMQYIPNGVNLSDGEKDFPIESSDYILFSAGRIIPLKGLHLLLDALDSMQYRGKLIVIGDLNQMEEYKALILEKAKSLQVEFLGLIKEKWMLYNYIKKAKFFIFPSLSENMSVMLLEVASKRIPMVCSDIPENKVVFSEDEVQYFKSGDAMDLKNKIELAFRDEASMQKKALKAYKALSEKYTWDKISPEYALLYEKIS